MSFVNRRECKVQVKQKEMCVLNYTNVYIVIKLNIIRLTYLFIWTNTQNISNGKL